MNACVEPAAVSGSPSVHGFSPLGSNTLFNGLFMRLEDDARFWDIRFDVPHKYSVKQNDGSSREYEGKQHKLACVAARTIAEAVALVLVEWPNATIWQANNHGRECHVLVSESLR